MPKRDETYMQARRDEILDAATACLVRTGIAGLSTSAICDEAQISMGALYTHFKTKYDILLGLVNRQVSRKREKFNTESVGDLRKELLGVVKKLSNEFDRVSTRIDMELLSAANGDRRLEKVMQAIRSDRSLSDALAHLKGKGEVPSDLDADSTAAAIQATLLGMQLQVLIGGHSSKTQLAAMNQVLDGLLTGRGGVTNAKKSSRKRGK